MCIPVASSTCAVVGRSVYASRAMLSSRRCTSRSIINETVIDFSGFFPLAFLLRARSPGRLPRLLVMIASSVSCVSVASTVMALHPASTHPQSGSAPRTPHAPGTPVRSASWAAHGDRGFRGGTPSARAGRCRACTARTRHHLDRHSVHSRQASQLLRDSSSSQQGSGSLNLCWTSGIGLYTYTCTPCTVVTCSASATELLAAPDCASALQLAFWSRG